MQNLELDISNLPGIVHQETDVLSRLETGGENTSELEHDITVFLLEEGTTTEEATMSISGKFIEQH